MPESVVNMAWSLLREALFGGGTKANKLITANQVFDMLEAARTGHNQQEARTEPRTKNRHDRQKNKTNK